MDIREAMMVITGRICQYYIEVRPADLNEVTRSETIWERRRSRENMKGDLRNKWIDTNTRPILGIFTYMARHGLLPKSRK
jgi:hypothetical protein